MIISRFLLVFLCLFMVPDIAAADDTGNGVQIAPVVVDGEMLLQLRGVSAVPAKYRAAKLREDLLAVANDPAVDPASGRVVTNDASADIYFADQRVVRLYPIDAQLEEVPLKLLAEATLLRMQVVIEKYRAARTPEKLLRSTAMFVALTAAAAVLIWLSIRVLGWIDRLVERRVKGHIERLEKASHRIIHGGQIWSWIGIIARGVRLLAVIAIILTWVSTALGLYPWTRPLAGTIFRLVLDPLRELSTGFIHSIPDFAFLVILAFVVRFILRGVRTFFERVGRGWIRLESFDRDWAMPTYRIVRVLIIAFGLIVAYPYIPGSESEAFKGVGIFMGVVLSIGSTSFIANMIAGYSLTYRAAYREGDVVGIGEHIGEVVEIRALSTRIKSMKNEEINIPNSTVLGSSVINYNAYQRKQGLILHTQVSIGYDTSWRQVEAMLMEAATRTPGLLSDPEPFVLQRSLGDFAVDYELNAYCRDAKSMAARYSALHANIQDVFNEYGVQIMSPNYEHDPEQPKTVPPDRWYAAPARRPVQTGTSTDE